jgi:exonuclease VII small subunit
MSLGGALARLGERESGTARLEEAVAAFRAALVELTRERVPLQWAQAQTSLGSSLAMLGERESGTARLEEAATAYRAALEVFTAVGAEHYMSICRRNRDRAQALLNERSK